MFAGTGAETMDKPHWLRARASGPYNVVSTYSAARKGHEMSTTGAGLEGVIAGESEICYIDGYAGILSYRGYNIHTLAENATFEEVVYLLWNGRLPTRSELEAFKADLVANREIPKQVLDFLGTAREAVPMDVL